MAPRPPSLAVHRMGAAFVALPVDDSGDLHPIACRFAFLSCLSTAWETAGRRTMR
ncbi:MAG: hypothetical protein ABEI96_08390 [Haloarculaceae archaeon]